MNAMLEVLREEVVSAIAPSDLSIVVFESAAEFATWWTDASPSANFLRFQDPRVMAVWEQTIGAGMGASCRVVRVDDRTGKPLLAVFLCLERSGAGERCTVSFMDGGVCDYNAPILFESVRGRTIEPKALWKRIASALPRHDSVSLRKMPRSVKGLENPLFGIGREPHAASGHSMSLVGDWSAVEREKGGHKIFKAAKRNLRLLGERGEVKLVIAATAAERRHFLDALIEEKRLRLAEMGLRDMFARDGIEEFYRACAELGEPEVTHLSGLCVGDEIVATNFGFIDDERFYGVLTAFARGPWARYSCGNLHLHLIIRWATENGLSAMDLGIGDEAYKQFWADQDIELVDAVYPVSARARRGWLFRQLRRKLRDVLGHAP